MSLTCCTLETLSQLRKIACFDPKPYLTLTPLDLSPNLTLNPIDFFPRGAVSCVREMTETRQGRRLALDWVS